MKSTTTTYDDGRAAGPIGGREVAPDARRIVVLGGGITGLSAAWELSRTYRERVLVVEKQAAVGGLAATFFQDGNAFDIGSHRIHPECDAATLRLMEELCGGRLLRRERRGRIRIGGNFLRYPPTPLDVLLAGGLRRGARRGVDLVAARLARKEARPAIDAADTFESYAVREVGRSLYDDFYAPYARKLWAMSGDAVAAEPAVSRVRKFTLRSIVRDLRARLEGAGRYYYYPEGGIGAIAEGLRKGILARGGAVRTGCVAESFELCEGGVRSMILRDSEGRTERVPVSQVISTIPARTLSRLVETQATPATGEEVTASAALGGDAESPFPLLYRGLRILYLITPDEVVGDCETFYFPEPDLTAGRVSELRRYSPALNAVGPTVLTVEVPCSPGEELWEMDDAALARRCHGELLRFGVLRPAASGAAALRCFSRKIEDVYPIYAIGWRDHWAAIRAQIDVIENLYPIGRSSLFLQCNIDHCIQMGLRLARLFVGGRVDPTAWRALLDDCGDYRLRD